MRIRHLTAADNVDSAGFLRDATQVRHGIVVAGRVAELAGLIDPLTHLNLDFADHRLEGCLVAEQLVIGAPLRWQADAFCLALPRATAFGHHGPVAVEARRLAIQRVLGSMRSEE